MEEVGRIIADGIIEKTLDDEKLKELTLKFAKNVPTMANISIWNLSEELSTGTIDSRLVVIGNAFLVRNSKKLSEFSPKKQKKLVFFQWNLLKTSMSSIREKFENYKFKIHTMSATSSSLQSIDFSSSRIRAGEHCIQETEIFRKMDLLEIYNSVVFRKSGDLNGKSKQIIKNYFAVVGKIKNALKKKKCLKSRFFPGMPAKMRNLALQPQTKRYFAQKMASGHSTACCAHFAP